MKNSKLTRLLLPALAILTGTTSLESARAAAPMYFLCETKPITTSIPKWWFSGIFLADPAQDRNIEIKFTQYVLDNYPDDNPGPADCQFWADRDSADRIHSGKKRQLIVDRSVIETGWSY